MATEIKNRFLSAILQIKEIRGEQAEEKVKEALKELQKEGKIENFGQTMKFSIEDLTGIDFIIFWKAKKKILLQVKGYPFENKRKYRKRNIQVIMALPEENVSEVKRKIFAIIERKTKRK
ncbi:hypothetical protein KAU51_01805 [Candidatus Parcubacteria bacterium]|nr:hypothetical protein [Candidatus Parcubacteria bacterium]